MIARRTLFAAPLAGLAAPRAARAAEELKLAVSSSSFVLGGVMIGIQAGLFEKNGLDLRIVVMDSGNAALSATISGSVPFSVAGPPDVLTARARGQDLVIVGSLYAGFAGSVVIAKAVADRLGVSPAAPVNERLRALDGIVLAVPSATSVLLAPVRQGVAEAGGKARFIYMAQGAMAAALEKDAVGGMVASYPFAGTPIVRGSGVLWIDGPGGELPADVTPSSSSTVQATRSYIAANRPTVARLQASLRAIATMVETQPEAARRALGSAYPQLGPQELDLAFKQQWRNWTKPFLTEADMRQELKLLTASNAIPGADRIDPAAVLLGPLP